jgi:hypothetical protein
MVGKERALLFVVMVGKERALLFVVMVGKERALLFAYTKALLFRIPRKGMYILRYNLLLYCTVMNSLLICMIM